MNESQEWADLVVAVATEKLNNAELTEYREQVELEWMQAHDAAEAANEAADLANEVLAAAEANSRRLTRSTWTSYARSSLESVKCVASSAS